MGLSRQLSTRVPPTPSEPATQFSLCWPGYAPVFGKHFILLGLVQEFIDSGGECSKHQETGCLVGQDGAGMATAVPALPATLTTARSLKSGLEAGEGMQMEL